MERLDAFMARANALYYATHDPFADFTTAPEISQVFGELLGLWAAETWRAMGSPDPVRLVEAGPGRGTLMADALRAAAAVAPAFRAAVDLHLIETSPTLRAKQAERLPATWHDALDTVPPGPTLLLANEFLDALPICQARPGPDGLFTERFVADGMAVDRPSDLPPTDGVVEWSDASAAFVRNIAVRVSADGGAALLVDYGDEGVNDSLQALHDGKPADPYADAGSADLTAHVDFAALALVAKDAGATVWGPVPQGLFLTRLGLHHRTGQLARGKDARGAAALLDGAARLAEPDRMGRLFKVMAITHPDLPEPAGFSA